MKRILMILAFAVSGITLLATGTPAQGPAGAGAGAAAGQKSESSHSYNPIKWIKKDKKAPEAADANSDQMAKLTARLQSQGIVADNADVKGLCNDFRELETCLAALHARHKLGLNFACMKANLTGVRTGVDTSSCRMPDTDKPLGLAKTLKLLKPDVDAKAATRDAEAQAKQDLQETRS